MKKLSILIGFLAMVLFFPCLSKAQQTVHHDLFIEVLPGAHKILASDSVKIPDTFPREFTITLHQGLEPHTPTPEVQIKRLTSQKVPVPVEIFQVTLPPSLNSFVLMYGGEIYHPLETYGKEYARGFQQTPGSISEEGVYLSASSFWYPHIDTDWLSFNLQLQLPENWEAVSQGKRTQHERNGSQTRVTWSSETPQEEIFLIAGKFIEYSRQYDKLSAMVFLRESDKKLADQYLEATGQYIKMYEELIGHYPYNKFALVENFWETGYGMPSFTLLGPKVIRFPFILHSSYPHEILHNWWGNSVYPDYGTGNWSEGLTAYLADHLIKEQRGQDAEHRQSVLQKYTDYVATENDFPLTSFTSRHSSVSEAVGYGKSLMLFHMLRQRLGDELFRQSLQQFYKTNRFKYASYDDLRQSFEEVSRVDLHPFFTEWITKTGAPQLSIKQAASGKENGEYAVSIQLIQEQPGPPYNLLVPLAITLEGREKVQQFIVEMSSKTQQFVLRVAARPLRIDVDPEFDLFRRLHRKEIPPALSMAFGAKTVLAILPASADNAMLDAYRALAKSWSQSGPEKVEIRLDSETEKLPDDQSLVLFGWENRFRPLLADALQEYDLAIREGEVRIGATNMPRANHSFVLTGLHPADQNLSLTWIATEVPGAAPGLGRKLPHYHKYSYLAFEGEEPVNIAKGRWPVLSSPLTYIFPDTDKNTASPSMAKLAARSPLINLPPLFSKTTMLETIHQLSDENLGGRGFGSPGLNKAAEYIAGEFQKIGLIPAGDGPESYFQEWRDIGGNPAKEAVLRNVIGYLPGQNPEMATQNLVVAAHYDHLGLGWPSGENDAVHPGADDNASGIAVLLELARVLADSLKPERNVVFVAFTGEEAGKKGSQYYIANQERFPAAQTIAMLNLDTVGRLGKGKLLIIGGSSAREWVHIFRGAGYVTGVEVTMVSEDLDSSDQKSFHAAGIPAVQLFTGPHLDYHQPTDIPEKIDADGLLKVASVAKEAVEYLANRKEFLSGNLEPSSTSPTSQDNSERKVSLGTVPDFAFTGIGYRLSGVVPGSPAEKAGLQEGDIIIRLGDNDIKGLRDVSTVLKNQNPGDILTVIYTRNDRPVAIDVTLSAK